jgi:hypothetical protein
MKTIDRLIFDTLAKRDSITFAGVGTIEVKRRSARKISEKEMAPPYNEVTFTPEEVEGAHNIVALVMADREVNEQEAVAIYGSWLEGALHPDGSLEIIGVGEVRGGRINVANQIDNELNPGNEKIMIMESKKGSTRVWVWIVIVVVALLAAGAIYCCKKGIIDCGSKKKAAVETIVTGVNGSAAADSLAAVEAAAATGAESAANVAGKGTASVSDKGTASVAGKGGATGVAGAGAKAKAKGTSTAKAASSGSFHIIAGAFAIESNADKFVTLIKRQHPELNPVKLRHPRNGLNMVSILSAPTRREASRKMNLYWDIDLNLWIYQER